MCSWPGARPGSPQRQGKLYPRGRHETEGEASVASALAGSPPEPLHPISPTFETEPDGRWAVLDDGTRIRLVVPLPS